MGGLQGCDEVDLEDLSTSVCGVCGSAVSAIRPGEVSSYPFWLCVVFADHLSLHIS